MTYSGTPETITLSASGLVIRVSEPLREVNRAVGRVQRGIFGVG